MVVQIKDSKSRQKLEIILDSDCKPLLLHPLVDSDSLGDGLVNKALRRLLQGSSTDSVVC